MQVVDLLKQLIAIDSTESHGTKQIAEYISELAESLDLRAEVFPETISGVEHANVVLSKDKVSGGNGLQELVLAASIETVNPGDYARWVRTGANPFQASIVGQSVFGLGVMNSKADLVAKMLALSANKKNYTKCRPIVLGTFGRENATGAARMVRKKILNPKGVIISSPTGLTMANKGPGYAEVEIRIPYSDEERKYREDHDLQEIQYSQSKLFLRKPAEKEMSLDDNPIAKMIEYLQNLPEGIVIMSVDGGVSPDTEPDSACLEIDVVGGVQTSMSSRLKNLMKALRSLSVELADTKDSEFEPDHSTITIGQIRSTRDEAVLSGVCRLIPAATKDHYEKWLEKLRGEVQTAGGQLRVQSYKPPFFSNKEAEFMQQLKGIASTAQLNTDFSAAGMCSEANIFSRLGIPSIAFGPGMIERGRHAAWEHISVAEVEKATQFYKKAIEVFCS